ncbi:MAG: hypothetical protein EOO03_01310 [Chitinophagaceae bacterium]|nr:MAG: hypothetical protein EOO03_01310 [Chitinophagaceae bacterium]
MKYLFIFIGFLCAGVANAQFTTSVYWTEQSSMPASEVIYFKPDVSLVWKDFKGAPVASSPAAAITASGFGYKASIEDAGNKGQLKIGVYCYFNKNNSWVKQGKTSAYILNHEQHHFNISYLAAKLFVDKLKAASFTKSNYNVLLPRIYNEVVATMNKMQDDYDGQTKNGQLKDMQARWDIFLSNKIAAFTSSR